jgi:hypothetical protein
MSRKPYRAPRLRALTPEEILALLETHPELTARK